MSTMERLLSILLVASTTATARKVVVLDDSEWDSVMVTSQPVKITNSRFNPKNNTHKDNSIDFDHSRSARNIADCEEGDLKCLYDNQLDEPAAPESHETVEKFLEKYSSVTNVKVNNEHRNTSSKAYWNQIDAQKHKHPFEDSQGWVTLDPVPWSTSKVSKWKPESQGDRPWAYGPPTDQQPSNSWMSNRPFSGERPSTNWGVGSNDIITDHKPNGFPLESYPHRPDWASQTNPAMPPDYLPPDRPHYTPVQPPANPNHPSYPQFQPPTQSQYQPPSQSQYPPLTQPQYQPSSHFQYQPPQQTYQYQPSQSSQPSYNPSYQYQSNKLPGSSYLFNNAGGSSNGFQSHPMSYPEAGRGEWVLVSTTKGYSMPQRFHDRQMHIKQVLGTMAQPPAIDTESRNGKSKYHENDIDDKFLEGAETNSQRKSDTIPEIGEPVWHVDGINILQASKDQREPKSQWLNQHKGPNDAGERVKEEPEITLKRTVRLTVLPALNNSSMLSHNGMLEVDSNPQTVDEAQREKERLKKIERVAVVSSGRQPYSVLPVLPNSEPDRTASKRAAVIAAVTAGMIPATMALLLPAALGRRKRRSAAAREMQR